MRLESISIDNYKSIYSKQVLDGLKTINILIGRNNSGKSSVLQCLELLRNIWTASSTSILERLPGKESSRKLSIELLFSFTGQERAIILDLIGMHKDLSDNFLRSLRWSFVWEERMKRLCPSECATYFADKEIKLWVLDQFMIGGGGEVRACTLPALRNWYSRRFAENGVSLEYPELIQQPGPLDSVINSLKMDEFFFLKLLYEFVENMFIVREHRSVRDRGIPREVQKLDENGQNLPEFVAWLKNNRPQAFNIFLDTMCTLVGDIKEIFTPLEGSEVALRVAQFKEVPPEQGFYPSNVGFGTSQLMIIVAAIVGSKEGSLIMLEEPEACVHPAAQRALLRFIQEHCTNTNKQVIMSAHSTVFAPLSGDCSVYLVSFNQGSGTSIKQVSPSSAKEIRDDLGLQNADFYQKSLVVFWEGESEHVAMPILMRALGHERYLEQIWQQDCQGSVYGKRAPIRGFLNLLRDSEVQPFVFADDDEKVRSTLEGWIKDELLPPNNLYVWGSEGGSLGIGTNKEFEDNWTPEQLIDAANEQAKDNRGLSALDIQEFKRRKAEQPSKKTSKVLGDYYYEIYREPLSKPELNRRIALSVAEELTGSCPR